MKKKLRWMEMGSNDLKAIEAIEMVETIEMIEMIGMM
jgi:hypothetical protein